ncbi:MULTISPECIES: oxidoreductase-like domain-containing protein [unclassified Xanthomonas]|uniref:oxidoreductase-like domain-containing protein n=1 Tax=unclassified Xanthomonas TaxID=2643310 RepID=UPI0016161AB7|nr:MULTISPECIES: oxidoreductase-like domain-containing protein [unclassified Xanthomonas]MBB4129344.1 hypothetical protein [Xanthomonas sp. 3075]MBB5862786.1 hypothetical protein [Xanthomonas sp. 3058]
MHERAASPADPRPQPPQPPAPNACCESGCPLCVLDLYADELASYRQALAAWEARQQAPAQ